MPGNKVTPPTKDTTQGSYLGFSAPQTQTKEITEDGNTEFIYKYERKSYDLNINPNGGKYEGSQSTVTVTQKFESTYTVSDKIEAPAGYVVTFKNFGGQDNYTKKTSTKTFTNWTKTGQGTLSGNVYTYGAGIGTIVANYKNDSIEMPDDPTHEGYTFTGWYLDEQCTNKVSLNTDKTYTPSQNITLYSGWSINKYALTISRLSGNTTKEQNYNTQLDLSTYNTSGYKVTLNPNYEGGANTVLTQTHKSWSKDGFGTLSGNIYTYGAGNGKVTENYNDVTLTTPTQAGYTFVGWYTDLELKNEVKLNADNTYTPTSNITLYAKWTANTNTKYTVKHYKQNIDGTYPSVPSEEEVKYGTTKETTNADPKTYKGFTTPAKQNKEILANGTTIIEYKYVRDLSTLTINPNGGTYSKDLNIEQAYESTYVVDNANITPPKGYTVTYNANGGTTEVGSEVSTKTFEGWVLTGGGKFVGNTYTFGTKDEEGTLTANYKNNSISLTTAKKVGYTFTGWYLDSNCTQALVLNADGTYTPQKDITIYAGWSANQVTYKVYRYLENANNENYTLYGDVIEGKAAAGSTLILLTEANKNQIANTKYVGANLTGGTLGVGTSITTTTVAPDGTTNIYLYYDRNEYTLTLEKNEYIETVTGAGTYKWGATVAINATVKTNITGYNASVWDKWTLTEGNGVTVPTTIKGNIVMTAGNITIVANAVKGTPITYSVVYNGSGATGGTTASSTHTYDKAQNLTANGYKKEYTVTFNYNYSGSTNTVATYKYDFVNWKDSNNNTYLDKASVINLAKTSGAIVTLNANWQEGENDPLPSAKRTGYGLAGWYTDKECTDANKVGDPGASYKVNANTTLYAKWEEGQVEYTVKYYIQNIEGTGYDLKDTEIKAGKTGTTTNATPKTYVGFTTPEEKTATIAADSSTVIEYYYTRNSYTLTLAKNEHVKEVSATGEVSGITNTSKSYKYGENIDLSATLNDIAGYTYTFVNWASNNTSLVANTTQKDAKITMPAGNVTLTANGSRTIQNYTITYNLNGGALVAGKTNPTSYNVESQNITLNNPQKTGYTFTGWTGSNGATPSTTVTIAKGSTGNKNYTANYNVNQYEVTYIDVVGSTTGKVLGTSKENVNFGTQVTGASKGTDVTVGKYYAGYVYSSATTATVTTSGATVYRIFTAYDKTKYTVEHYVMKTDGTYDTAATKVDSTKTGTTDSEVTIANLKDSTLLVTNGIYYSYGQVDGKTVTSTTIKGDGTRVIKLYYARTSGTLKTVAGENIESVTVQNSVKYYYGATVPSLTAKTMAIEGHTVTFSKWTSNNETYVKSSTVNPYGTFTWPAIPDGTAITLTASASKTPNKYEVTYKDVVGSTTGKVLGTSKESVNFGTQVTGASKGTDTTEGAYYKGYLYDSSTTATVTTSGATVYRIFKPSTNTKYTVSRYLENANDNTYTLYDTTTKTGTTDSTLTLSTEAKSLEIANTTFAGGNLVGGTSGVGTVITSTTVKPDGSTKICLYYTRNKFTLELSKNDYISSVTGAGSYKWGQNVTIKANVKANDIYYIYGFANWTKDGVQYETESTKQFSMGTQNLSLVANGKILQGQEYTVTFEPKGGTITTNTKKVNYSSTYGNLPAVNGQEGLTAKTYTLTYNYKYTGKANSSKQYACSLNGWYKEEAYTNIVTSASKVTTASNHTLYAKWNNPSVTLETPVRAGYTFDGWYTDESLKTKAGNGGASYSIGANTTLYAKWIANTDTKYTVVHKKMNLDGTYPEGNSPIAGKVEVVEKAGTTDSNVTPETNTYTGFTAPEKQTVTIKGDGTTVVVYEYSRNKYTFTLGSLIGVSNAGSTATGSYYYETVITLKATVNTGYTWSKWESSNTSMQANITGQSGSFTMPAGNITMTPKVTANTYTVNYNGNGATGGTTASSTHTYDKAQNLTLNGYVRQYTVTFNGNYEGSTSQTAKSTYAFKDWNLKNDGTGNAYTNGQSVTNLTSTNNGTVTLYAMWDNTVSSAKVTLPTLTRANYVFEGWYKEQATTTLVGTAGNTYTPSGNITLYAKWSLANYSVTTKNGSYYFKTLAEAVAKADSDGSTITILQTNTDISTVIIDKNVTINTNGKTVTRNATITVNNEKTVTINGTGGFTTSATNTFTLNGGNLTVNDGTIYSSGAVAIGQTGAGTINILGGTIKGKTAAISSLQAATVNIGNNSNSIVSAEAPVIEATAGYGINLTGTSSKLNFNCGVIKGTSKTTYNGIDVAFNVAGSKTYRSGYGAKTTLANSVYSTILVKATIAVNPTQVYLNTTTNKTKALTITGASLGTLSYSTNDANIATISNGTITALKQGECTITVKEANAGLTATCKVIVDDILPVWTIEVESVE